MALRRTSAVLAAAAVALAAGCGHRGAPTTTAVVRGVTVTVPAGWHRATTSLTPHLVAPRELLTVATFRPRYRPTGCAQLPGSALAQLGATGALVTLLERRGGDGFPPRPRHFGPHAGDRSEASACVPGARFTDHFVAFSASGRHFYALVAFGPHTPEHTRAQAWSILDTLHITSRDD